MAGNANRNGYSYSKDFNSTPQSYGVATDEFGNIFFSELKKSTVTKVDVEGNVVLVAGDVSERGFSGDGGLATNAKLDGPQGISVDKNGNIYIADTDNDRVRKIDQNGIITTIAGNGNGGDGGLAVNARIITPVDVITDSIGNIYISEQGRNKIRKINTTGIISTIAGNGNAGFSGDGGKAKNANLNAPTGICFDKDGNLIIADTYNRRIRKVNKNGIIITIAGNGTDGNACGKNDALAIDVPIGKPTDVDVDTTGNIFLLAASKCYVQYIDSKGYIYNLANIINTPQSLTYSKANNKIYYSTIYEDLCWGHIPNVLSVDLNSLEEQPLIGGSKHAATYNGDSIASTIAHLSSTKGIAFIEGDIYFVDANFYRIRKLDDKGIITTIAGKGVKGSDGFGDGGSAINAKFNEPAEIIADKNGNIYISDAGDNRIRKINKQGIITTAFKVSAPQGIAFDTKGNLFYSSRPNVYKINTGGKISIVAGDGSSCWTEEDSVPATKTCLNYPVGLYIDDDDNLYIADKNAAKIRKVDTTGIITTIAGDTWASGYNGDNILAKNAWLSSPTGVTQDNYGNFIITDNGNHRIRKIDSKGIINTIAGGGFGDHTNCDGEWFDDGTYSGDDGAAIGANLNYPYNVAFDTKNNYFISDANNNRIREVINNCISKPSPTSIAMQQYINKKFTLQYDCYLLATLTPRLNYLSTLNATVVTNVWVEKKTIADSSGKTYVQRHYQIFAEKGKRTKATARLTLYFTQAEFNAYNTAAGNSYLKLPSLPTDAAAISNLIVYSYKSRSNDGTGFPDSYEFRQFKINPDDADITWNDTAKYWEVSFDVDALGGFFIGTEKINTAIVKEEIQIKESGIKVYPNPAADKVYITVPSNLLYKKIILCDASGKIVNSMIAGAESSYFNINNLATGIYYLKFDDGTVKKLVHSK